MSHTSEECGYLFRLCATAIVKPFLEKAWQWPYCIIFSILHFTSFLVKGLKLFKSPGTGV